MKKQTNVFAPKELTGIKNGARQMDVKEDKFGMEPHVFVNQDTTSTVTYVCCVSMGNPGMKKQRLVTVLKATFGMETTVRKKLCVQEIECGMLQFNNVSAQTTNFGMDLVVWLDLHVVVEKSGMKRLFNVIALSPSTGMDHHVYFV